MKLPAAMPSSRSIIVAASAVFSAHAAFASPTFNSTSTGSDGALDFSSLAPGTTLEFDPTQLTNPATGNTLDPAGDNVFNFTTITIPSGVTIRLHANHNRNAPVYWLASGAVDIEGTLDLSGDGGHPEALTTGWGPSQPGPGGYAGGLGTTTAGILANPTAGLGPGGVIATGLSGGWECCGYPSTCGAEYANGAHKYGNLYLLPLIGGSGGNGMTGGGGAGGGAILIASSTSITVGGTLRTDGGPIGGPYAGQGSGGAIRLLAPTISGNGTLSASAPSNINNSGCSYGYIRLEAFQNSYTGSIQGASWQETLAPTAVLGLPTTSAAPLGFVNIVNVGGVTVPAAPTASFLSPDVTINSSQPLSITVAATNVPTSAAVTVYVFNENIGVQSASVTLSGTTGSSSGTGTVTLPPGFSHIYASATWTN